MKAALRFIIPLTLIGAVFVCLFLGIGHWMSFKGPAIDKVLSGRRVLIGNLKRGDEWISAFDIYAYLSPDSRHEYVLLSLVPRGTPQTVPTNIVQFELSGFDKQSSIKPVIFSPSDMTHGATEAQLLALDMLGGVKNEDWESSRLIITSSSR